MIGQGWIAGKDLSMQEESFSTRSPVKRQISRQLGSGLFFQGMLHSQSQLGVKIIASSSVIFSSKQSTSFHQANSESGMCSTFLSLDQRALKFLCQQQQMINRRKFLTSKCSLVGTSYQKKFKTRNISIQFHGKSLITILVAYYSFEAPFVMLISRNLQASFTTLNHS